MQPFDTDESSGPETSVEHLWQRWRQDQCPDFPASAEGGTGAERALAVLRFDQDRRWRSGERVPAEQYVETYSVLRRDPDQALVLIYGEFLLRQDLGERPTLDEYLLRFPAHAERLRQQDAFHRAVEGASWAERGNAPPAPVRAEQAGPCRIVGEIARGGMGVVLKGHDDTLGRDLAVKVLRDEYRDQPEVVRRFLAEAQVSGQLQHPGIVPIHELGRFADGRPYFTMKLVQGRTLAALLAERAQPAEDLPRWVKIFEQVCQTVAYAHARGVIHRDLKPANVMVGAFGEVQVMDWGLAKVLATAGRGDPHSEEAASPVRTVRSGQADAESRAGAVVGTPAYIAPEQARGEVSRLGERSDVFGLGAILCEILTGQPPYLSRVAHEALLQAATGDLAGALARLDGCGADAELVGLARECLAAAPEGRPRDAGVVAARVTAYLTGVQERLRRAEVERAAAQARAEEAAAKAAAERRARRLTVGLTAAGLALVLLVGGGGLWWVQRQAALAAAVQAALDRAGQLQAEGKPAKAEAAARQAEALLADGWGHADLHRRVREVRADVDMAGTLEEIRLRKAELAEGGRSHDPRAIDRAYAKAFQDYGLPVEDLTGDEAAERMRRRAIAVPLALALDDWALQRRGRPQGESEGWRHLLEVARRADPDEWRDRFRAALLADDPKVLPKLAAEAKDRELPAPTWLLLALAVQKAGSVRVSMALLQVSEHQHPDDFWTHLQLAELSLTEMKPPLLDKAIRHYSVARALRPGNPVVLCNLGKALLEKGLPEAAIPILKQALCLRPDFAEAHCNLSAALTRKGAWDEVLAAAREATRLKPDLVEAHFNCGLALLRGRPPRLPEALAAFDRTLALRPGYALGHSGRGRTLLAQGEVVQALAAFDRALELQPDLDDAHHGRFDALFQLEKYTEALAAADRAVELLPTNAAAHGNRSRALARLGRFEDALAAVDRAIQLLPKAGEDLATAHHLRGQILKNLGRYAEAADACRQAVRLHPAFAEAYCELGLLLQELGQFGEALPTLRQGRELGSKQPGWPYATESATWLSDCRHMLELERRLPAVLSGAEKPADADEQIAFARCCWYKRRYGAAARFYQDAFAARPALVEDLEARHRFSAVRAAVLAGGTPGRDDPPLDEVARARWRKQAVDWLRADLAAWAKRLDGGKPEARTEVRQVMELWKDLADFATLRDAAELAKLPNGERQAWQALWADVDALLQKTQPNGK